MYSPDTCGNLNFHLADFGLCNVVVDAQTGSIGTTRYLAPEIATSGPKQTCKVDIWSLFVTFAEATNVGGFREKLHAPKTDVGELVKSTARLPAFSSYRTMGLIDVDRRASAADMLDHLFDGEGRAQRN